MSKIWDIMCSKLLLGRKSFIYYLFREEYIGRIVKRCEGSVFASIWIISFERFLLFISQEALKTALFLLASDRISASACNKKKTILISHIHRFICIHSVPRTFYVSIKLTCSEVSWTVWFSIMYFVLCAMHIIINK